MSLPVQAFLKSMARFGVVGAVAVLLQALLFVGLTSCGGLSGFSANTLAFAASLVVSYFGQSRWTFVDRKKRSVLRFLVIAAVSFCLGSGGAWLVVDKWGMSSTLMLPVILIFIPFISFLMMRSWVFTRARREPEVES